ncbi:MAG: hypothetical protein ABI221_03790 [Candidatus Saccharimonadales bacterium]
MDPLANPTTPPAAPVAPSQPADAGGDNLPDTWPGAFGLFKYSKQSIMTNLGTFLGSYAIFIAISIVLGILLGILKLNSLSRFASDLLSPLYALVATYIYLASSRGQKLTISQAFGKINLMLYLKMLGLMFLEGIIIIIGVLLLVVPFFFVLPRIILAPYYLIDKNLGIMESLSASWNDTKGHSGKIWGIIGAIIVMILPILTIVGIIATIYLLVMYSVAFALAYRFIAGHSSTAAAPSPQTPPAVPPVPAAI